MRRAFVLATLVTALAPAWLALAPAQAGASAGPGASTGVGEELARAVALHPDDPDLLFALASHLEGAGDAEGAAERFQQFARRFPERRPDLWLRLGRLLQELGRHEQAVPVLERAVASRSEEAAAHLHLGISLRHLGRHAEAERHFGAAGGLAPELLPEASLLRALARMELGDERAAVAHLERTLEIDPDGEAGRSARLLLRATRGPERGPWIRFDAFGGYETDTNVTLDGATDLPGVSRERADARAVWGAGITVHPLRHRLAGITLGVRYDQAEQEEISTLDTRRELAFVSLRVSPHERIALRLDGLATRTRLDHRRYQRTRSLRPNFFFSWGERAGVTQTFAHLEQLSYPEAVFSDAFIRDGWAAGGGFEHFVPLPGRPGTWLSAGADFLRYDTDSQRDPILGFASPYDHDRWRATLGVRGPLLLGFESEASFSWAREDFEHRNFLDLLSSGNLDPSTRRDTVLEGRFSLVRPVTRYAAVELRFQQTDRRSNLDLYDYDRRIVGLYLRVHTP